MARIARPASGAYRPATPLPSRHAAPAQGSSTPSMPRQSGQVAQLSGTQGGADLPAPWASDPILMQIQAINTQNQAAAEASATTARQQALIAYGYDPTLDQQGLYDSTSRGGAQANSFSTLQNLKRQHDQRQTALNENLNKQNLFFSSTRGVDLGNEGTQYLGEQAAANQKLQGDLGGIAANLLSAKQGAQGNVTQGETDAYGRYLQNALANVGGTPGVRTAVRAAAGPNRAAQRTAILRRQP